MPTPVRLSAFVHGYVQGVGFRWWTRSRALELGLVGYASNQADGRVHVVAEGPPATRCRLCSMRFGPGGRPPGRVDLVVDSLDPARGDLVGFLER